MCRSSGFLLVIALLAPAAASAQTPDAAWTPEQQAVIDAASSGPVGIESDFGRWESGYDPEWTYWRIGTDEVRPRDVHMDLVRGVIEDGNRIVGFELSPVDVIVRGDVALMRLNAVETLQRPDGSEEAIRYSAASMFTKESGEWRVLATNIFYPPA